MNVGECGHIVSQCKCAGHKRVIKVKGLCVRCKALEPRADAQDAIPSSEARVDHKFSCNVRLYGEHARCNCGLPGQ